MLIAVELLQALEQARPGAGHFRFQSVWCFKPASDVDVCEDVRQRPLETQLAMTHACKVEISGTSTISAVWVNTIMQERVDVDVTLETPHHGLCCGVISESGDGLLP